MKSVFHVWELVTDTLERFIFILQRHILFILLYRLFSVVVVQKVLSWTPLEVKEVKFFYPCTEVNSAANCQVA